MEKTATMNLRVNPSVKQGAEEVLRDLGIPMATAIDIYLRQIALAKGLPFPVLLQPVPTNINADNMTEDELHSAIMAGYQEMEEGKVVDAGTAFADFRKKHS